MHRNRADIALGIVRFRYGICHLVRFPETDAHMPVTVTDGSDRIESKTSYRPDDLRYAVDRDQLID
jgi:hypothetical protein